MASTLNFPRSLRKFRTSFLKARSGFKLFMGSQIGGLNIDDDEELQDAFREVAPLGVPVALHAEDKALLAANENKLKQAKKISVCRFPKAHIPKRLKQKPSNAC